MNTHEPAIGCWDKYAVNIRGVFTIVFFWKMQGVDTEK